MSGFMRTAGWLPACILVALTTPLAAQQKAQITGIDKAIAGRPAEVFSVGKAEGEDWELFSDVASVAFDGADNLYILDRGNARVLAFAPDGSFLRQIGQRGGGPGELQAPLAMTVTPEGEIVVSDVGRRAFSVFGTDGAYRRSVPFADDQGLPAGALLAHPAGGVVMAASHFSLDRLELGRESQPAQPDSTPFLWYRLEGAAQPRTLASVPAPAQSVKTHREGGQGGAQFAFRVSRAPTFAPTLRWGVLPNGGVAAATASNYRVQLFGPDGQPYGVIERPLHPRRVTDKDKERAREQLSESLRTGKGAVRIAAVRGAPASDNGAAMPELPARVVEDELRNMTFADLMPVIAALRVDPRGVIWVQRTGKQAYEPGPIDLITVGGRYLGTMRDQQLPDGFSRTGLAAYVEEDELGVQRVVVRRLPEWG